MQEIFNKIFILSFFESLFWNFWCSYSLLQSAWTSNFILFWQRYNFFLLIIIIFLFIIIIVGRFSFFKSSFFLDYAFSLPLVDFFASCLFFFCATLILNTFLRMFPFKPAQIGATLTTGTILMLKIFKTHAQSKKQCKLSCNRCYKQYKVLLILSFRSSSFLTTQHVVIQSRF